MSAYSVNFTIFPLSQRPIGGIIEDAVHDFQGSDVEVQVGPMNIAISGKDTEVLSATLSGLRAAKKRGDAILEATVSIARSA